MSWCDGRLGYCAFEDNECPSYSCWLHGTSVPLAEGPVAGALGVREEAEGDLGRSAQCGPELPTGRDQGTVRSVLRPR